jgi:hypothetical protein
MALANTYLTQVKNLGAILESIRGAQAPERFTAKFLENLGFKSTNDRLIIPVLKALGFIDESGAPKQRYFRFLDQEFHRQVLAEGIREAYGDLFALNTSANQMGQTWVKNKLKTLTQGAKSEAVLVKMAMTFTALSKYADFSASPPAKAEELKTTIPQPKTQETERIPETGRTRPLSLAYNIHVELPAVRDQAVYDAIFRSLRENLL